jgi:hypothetical protein
MTAPTSQVRNAHGTRGCIHVTSNRSTQSSTGGPLSNRRLAARPRLRKLVFLPQTGNLARREERAANPVLRDSAISAWETSHPIDTVLPIDEIDPHRSAKSSHYRGADDPCPSQRHHSHPEHGFVADIDIVRAYQRQLAVIADAENRQASGERLYCVSIPHMDRQVVLGDQQTSTRVNMKGAWVDLLGLDVLDWRRLAGGLIIRYTTMLFSPPLKTCLP